ncbi:efflux RND transporter periplasmic adaptor subunit [Neisseria sp. ZJ106]|uniref:Efflux RND transporter periplasmic adaptor subunit n=1 Tax=Neisseria lisongii TaxID=2912188 RepID=A0AAW5ALN4_9NEIS|nr:efflux RND transporter periplasmic adaptor subunit [Neisseria lisongii]MCF7521733.1 efflux RND transporter periplasmic adaptor subunit [Neisseria lisongii]MCF7529385.1 efflux RND transporter periplasmic adaptor subunit [Neisseria lisongii]WCL70825.1 efflux RND transporter periplasmic adaptor subunit [Neisseria lisongii]
MAKMIKWAIGAVLVAAAGFAAWKYFFPQEVPPKYLTEPVKRSTVRQTVSATGEISPSNMVDVGAQASGQIKKLHVKIGQFIQKGDLIAEIDSTTQINTLNTNRAKLDTLRAQLVSAEIALRSAGKKHQREAALWREEATSKEELETAEDALAAAKARVAELKSSIRQMQIAINTAEADLGYTRIAAPIAGTVVSIPVEEGQTVNANQTAPTIIQLANLETMLNKMQIAEGDITKVKAGQPVSFTILSEADKPFEAALDSIDPGLTTLSQGSYSKKTDTTENAIYYYARALVPNPEGKLAIGMTTQNTIEISSAENVLTVPVLAVKRKNGKAVVRVLNAEGKAEERMITTGLKDNMNVEVKSGLKEGEQVVLSELEAGETPQGGGKRMGPPM